MFGYRNRLESPIACCYINVAAHKVHEVGALKQQLRHPGIVIIGGGNVTITALFGFARANSVRNERAECLAGKTRRGNGLLLIIEPLTIRILRTDQHRARRTGRSNAVPGNSAIDAEHVNVVAQNLKVVAGVIPGGETFVMQHTAFCVGGHLQMAPEACRRP